MACLILGSLSIPTIFAGESAASPTWERAGVVMDVGSFNRGVQYPDVIYENGIYKMWYTGVYSSLDAEIFYATSSDGINWTDHGCVLPKLPGTEYVVAPWVLQENDGTYKMWFSAHDGYNRARTYMATSPDGISWTNQGLAFDLGPAGSPDSMYAVQAGVFIDSGTYRMYYKSYDDNSVAHMMYASSLDGHSWAKHGAIMEIPPNYSNMQCPRVWKVDDGTYKMIFDATDGNACRILKASSPDGITWTQEGVALDVGAPGDLDDAGIMCPCIVGNSPDGLDRLYYAGYDGAMTRIFLAMEIGVPVTLDRVDISVSDLSISNASVPVGDTISIDATIHGDSTMYGNVAGSSQIFSDDFDDGTTDKWGLSGWNPCGVLETSTAESHSAPYSLHMQSDPNVNTGPWVVKFFDDEYTHIKGETSFYLPEKAQEYEGFDILRLASAEDGWTWNGGDLHTDYNMMIRLQDDNYGVDIIEAAIDGNGARQFQTRATDICELAPLAWHRVSLEIDGNDFILTIDDNEVFSAQRLADTPIDFIFLGDPGGQGGCGGDAYWDDVNVWAFTDQQEIIHQGLDANCTVSFYLDSIDEANLIDRQYNVQVPADGTVAVSADWTAVDGSHDIMVELSDVNPQDSDLSNNIASVPVFVEPANQAPTADAGPDITASTGQEIMFDASGSYDPDGSIISYDWDFGDGSTGTGVMINHAYDIAGNYSVTLTVTDDDGAIATDTCQVIVSDLVIPPEPAQATIAKEKTLGPDTVITHTPYGWVLEITVENTGGSDALDIVVNDVLPAELNLINYSASKGNLDWWQNGGGNMGSTGIQWQVGTLAPGEIQHLELIIATGRNPAGHQEFTSPGNYSLNDGAWLTGVDSFTGDALAAGPTDPIRVTAVDMVPQMMEEPGVESIREEPSASDPNGEAPLQVPNTPAILVENPEPAPARELVSVEKSDSMVGSTLGAAIGILIISILAIAVALGRIEAGNQSPKNIGKIDELDMKLLRGEISEDTYLHEIRKIDS